MRKKIKLERTLIDKFLDAIIIGLIIFSIVMTFTFVGDLPDRIPTHFNAAGEPDGYGSPGTLMMLTLMGATMGIGLYILNYFPHLFNIPVEITEENMEVQYRLATRMIRALNISTMLTFLYLGVGSYQTAMNEWEGLGSSFLPVMLSVTFGIIIVYFIAARKER